MKALTGSGSRRIRLVLPLALVLLDLASKYLAYFLLKGGRQDGGKILSFYLVLNKTGSNAILDAWGLGGGHYILTMSLFFVTVALAALVMDRLGSRRLVKAGVYAVLFLAYCLLVESSRFAQVTLGPVALNLLRYLSGIGLGVVFLALTKDPVYATLWAVYVSGGIGNFLSSLLPPFGIIDFMYFPALANSEAFGVFNLADVYATLFMPGFLLYSLFRLGVLVSGGLARLGPARKHDGGARENEGDAPGHAQADGLAEDEEGEERGQGRLDEEDH
jgi:lipoprotein signal peptidase